MARNVVNIEDVSKAFDIKELLVGVSLGVSEGDRIGIVGRNGSGKSTLMKVMAGIEPPDSGRVTKANSAKIGLLSQVDLANGGVASMFRERPEYSLGGPTKAIRKIGEPTQQESAAGLVFNPGPYEGPYEGPYILGGPRPGQYYQSSPITSITGPDGAIPRPGMPMMSSPSAQTLQKDVSTKSIAKALEMAGFTKEEIMRIIGERGYADGGLTSTVPPAMGPDSQGVETLFRRRYS